MTSKGTPRLDDEKEAQAPPINPAKSLSGPQKTRSPRYHVSVLVWYSRFHTICSTYLGLDTTRQLVYPFRIRQRMRTEWG
jgi:hypothetical protein